MVCKEDVLTWFKELESYKRIDAMCSLLNMCLPFELRFVGTYVEELGKRDFQELRGAELRANNPAELAHDIAAAAQDPRAPRKMALYVSLLRSCNSACAATLYAVLVGRERAGLLAGLRSDPLEELLLLYSMALHHPAFTFDQRSHFGEILDRLKQEEARSRQPPPPPHPPQRSHAQQQHQHQPQHAHPQQPPQQPPPQHQHQAHQADCASCAFKRNDDPPRYCSPPPYEAEKTKDPRRRYPQEPPPPCGTCQMQQQQQPPPPPQQQPLMFVKTTNRPQGPPGAPDQINEIVNPAIGSNTPVPNDPIIPVLAEGVLPPPAYSVPQYNIINYNIPQEHWPEVVLPPEMPNFSTTPSPLISQPSSPCDSRSVSPNMQVPPPPLPTAARVTPRPAQDPQLQPPLHDQHLHPQHQIVTGFTNLNINDLANMDEEKLHEYLPQNVVAQISSIKKSNGLLRASHSSKMPPSTYCYNQTRHHQSSGSDSGSSTGSHSPPETPALPGQASIGPGRPRQPSPPLYYVQYPRTMFQTPYQFRPNFPPFIPNGEAPMYGPQYSASYVPVPVPNYTQPKLSCWNCGTMGHTGSDCKEPSIEEVTRAGGYQLDYSTAPPDINDK